jgi:hypothetical protein
VEALLKRPALPQVRERVNRCRVHNGAIQPRIFHGNGSVVGKDRKHAQMVGVESRHLVP